MQVVLATSLIVFFSIMVFVAILSSRRVQSGDDFVVAGRKLSPLLGTSTLVATWFAAESVLVSADVIRIDGLRMIAFDPVGFGLCLVIVGIVFAKRVWQTKMLTLPDVIGSRFGNVAEKLVVFTSLSSVSYAAVQLLALSGVLHVYFQLPIELIVVALAFILTFYTLLGGLWAVAITDIVQLVILIIGLIVLTLNVLAELGAGPVAGLAALFDRLDDTMLRVLPPVDRLELSGWLGLVTLGLFANIGIQEITQRIFGCRSASVAKRSCIYAGLLYIGFGTLPLILGLAGSVLLEPSQVENVVATLAREFLSPTMSIVFVVVICAAVTSSIDSSFLSPAVVIARNVIQPMSNNSIGLIAATRWCIVGAAVASVLLAISGNTAFQLIQSTFAMTLPAGVVLFAALFQKQCRPLAGAITLGVGATVWAIEVLSNQFARSADNILISPGFPLYLFLSCIAVYLVSDQLIRISENRKIMNQYDQ